MDRGIVVVADDDSRDQRNHRCRVSAASDVSGQTLASNSHVVKGSSAKHRECCAVDDDASVATTASGEKSEAALGRANPFFD